MKKIFKGVVSLVLAIATLSGCASKEQTSDANLLEQIKERGYIVVGTEGTYSPNSYHDETGALVGFDVEVAALVAKYLGVEVQYYETEWSSIFTALDSGKIDIVVNEVGYNEERAAKYDFSNPYAFVQQAVLTRADNTDIKSYDDLNGKVCANESTSLFGQIAESHGATLDPVNAMAQSISEVVNGRADATLNYITSFTSYMKENPDEQVKIAVYGETEPSSYIPVVKGNTELVNAINEALSKALESGELKAVSEKYFGVDVTAQSNE